MAGVGVDSVDTTEIVYTCPVDSTQNTFALSGLEAGSDISGNEIVLGTCSGCSSSISVWRTFDNPTKGAGAINGLHEYLIDNAQLNATQSAALLAETAPDKPTLAYTPTGTTADYDRGTDNGFSPIDTAYVIAILGTTATQDLHEQGLLYTDDDDSAVTTLVNSLYTDPDERTDASVKIRDRRYTEFGIA